MSSSSLQAFLFGPYRVDAARRLLLRDGRPVPLPPRAFDVLLHLVGRGGELVTKEDLLKAVWPDTFVEEANLAQNVSLVRKALGESPRDHRFIVTVPGRGYRFASEVRAPAGRAEAGSRAGEVCLRARQLLEKRLTGSLLEAIALFRQATDADPVHAPAWIGLADAYALLSLYGALRPREAFPKSKAAALRALAIDPALAAAHNAVGVVELFYEWNWVAADAALRRALELEPGHGDALQRYGIFLTAMGRFPEAAAILDRAQAHDPLSRIIATIGGYPAYYGRDYAAAARQFRHVLQMDPDFSMAHFRLGLTLLEQGDYAEAERELLTSQCLSNDRDVVAALGRLYALAGRREQAASTLAELNVRSETTFVAPYLVALIHAALGDATAAFDLLARAVEERSYWIMYLDVDPALDPLRGDPRFARLRDDAGLPAHRG